MASVITIAGEQLFAAKAQANEQLDIDTFIFANVSNQDPNAPINREEGIPTANIVYQQNVQQVGRINDNVVVYSTVLDSITGPFEFNWVGLYSSVNQKLVAINHVPTVTKTATAPGAAGNTLNRNFGIEYSGIADLTGITVEPETWQLDFTARLSGMDLLTQQLAADMNGKDWFIADGLKVVPRTTANTFSVTPGVGYVSGLRVELKQEHILIVQSYPQFVYVDAWFSGNANSTWSPQLAFTVTNGEMDDYVDPSGAQHYVYKLAIVNASDDIGDLRKKLSKSRIPTTVSEIKKGHFKVGDLLEVTDRENADFKIVVGGDYDEYSTIDAGNGNTAILLNNGIAINILNFGIKADNLTVNKLLPVSNYCNSNNINLLVENTISTKILFDDSLILRNNKIISKSGAHICYVGDEKNNMPVVEFGNDIENSHPEYFESNLPFRIGEGLTFTEGQGFGEVHLVMGGKVYFKWLTELVTDKFPTTGSVTGSESGQMQEYTSSTLKSKVYGAPNNAGFENLYLSTPILENEHLNCTGVLINGVRNGRSFGNCGSLSVEGFMTAGAGVYNWFLDIQGTLEAQKCADGFIFTSDNNAFSIQTLILSTGTPYDSVKRYRARFPFCYSYRISMLSLEGNYGESYLDISAGHGNYVGNVNIENTPEYAPILLRGSPTIDLFSSTNRGTEITKYMELSGLEIGPVRAYESLGYKLGKHIDGCHIKSGAFNYPAVTSVIPKEWKSIINDIDTFNVKGLKIDKIMSTNFDVSDKFRLQAVMDNAKVIYDNQNLKITEMSATTYKPAGGTSIQFRKPLGGNIIRYVVDSVATSQQGVVSGEYNMQVLNDSGIGESVPVNLSPEGYFFSNSLSRIVRTTSKFIRAMIIGLPSSDGMFSFTAVIREIKM